MNKATAQRWVSAATALKANLNVANETVTKLRAKVESGCVTLEEVADTLRQLEQEVLGTPAQIASFDAISSTPLVPDKCRVGWSVP